MQLRGLVVNLHVPGKIRSGLEAFGADRTLVRPRVAVFEHVTSEFALAIERDVADFASVNFLQTRRVFVGSRFRAFILVPFPEVQRGIVQVVEVIIRDLSLSGLDAISILVRDVCLSRRFFDFYRLDFFQIDVSFSRTFGGRFFGGRCARRFVDGKFDRGWFFHHEYAQ